MRRRIVACGVMLLVALAAAAALDARRQAEAFVTLLGAASIAYVAALRLVDRLARNRSAPRTDPPRPRRLSAPRRPLAPRSTGSGALVSDDAYRYVWDRAGTTARSQSPRDDSGRSRPGPTAHRPHAPDRSTSAVLPSIYPPLAQRFFLGVTLVHESVLAMAAAVLVCDLLIVGLIWRWLAATGRSPWWVLAYAWHPLGRAGGGGRGPRRRRRRAAPDRRGVRAVSPPFAPGRGRPRRRRRGQVPANRAVASVLEADPACGRRGRSAAVGAAVPAVPRRLAASRRIARDLPGAVEVQRARSFGCCRHGSARRR